VLSYLNIVENIDIKEVIAMQISGYSSAAMLAYRSSGMKQKAGTVKMQDFSQMVQNTSAQATSQTDKTAATKEVSEVDEMAAFKQEIYEELAEIDKMNSSAILSNSVHITEDGFKRMKEDPAYRKEIMDWLRADARASHGVPFGVHVTTTITGAGATCYGANVYHDDSAATKAAKKDLADKKAEGSFYHSDRTYADRRAAQRKRDREYVASERQKRELMQKMMLEKSIDQKAQRQLLDQKALAQNVVDQKYVQDYLLGKEIPLQGGLVVKRDPKTGLNYLSIKGNEAQGVSVIITSDKDIETLNKLADEFQKYPVSSQRFTAGLYALLEISGNLKREKDGFTFLTPNGVTYIPYDGDSSKAWEIDMPGSCYATARKCLAAENDCADISAWTKNLKGIKIYYGDNYGATQENNVYKVDDLGRYYMFA